MSERMKSFASIVAALFPGAVLTGLRALTGGVSAAVYALEVEGPDASRRTVVLRHHRPREDRSAAAVARSEDAILRRLRATEIPVPEPLGLDVSGEHLPGAFLVMSFEDGSSELAESEVDAGVATMAKTLARVHDLAPESLFPGLPRRSDPIPELLDFLPKEGGSGLRESLERIEDSEYRGRASLLHGDFWPGNLLWRGRELSAILDWEDAAIGDPLSDVALARLEIIHAYDRARAAAFTRMYAQLRPVDHRRLALWDLYVAAAMQRFIGGWGLEPEREARMRANAEVFMGEASRRLDGFLESRRDDK